MRLKRLLMVVILTGLIAPSLGPGPGGSSALAQPALEEDTLIVLIATDRANDRLPGDTVEVQEVAGRTTVCCQQVVMHGGRVPLSEPRGPDAVPFRAWPTER